MKIERIRLGCSMTINLGNYQNAKPSVELDILIDEGETASAAYLKGHAMLKTMLTKSSQSLLTHCEKLLGD